MKYQFEKLTQIQIQKKSCKFTILMSQEHLQKQIKGFLNTQPLWNHVAFGVQQFEFPKLDLTHFIPETIPSKIRLGHQMESVFKQLINHSKEYEILLHNLPVKSTNKTIGEIDFILKDIKTTELIHIELTYKFYIINPEISSSLNQLIGPNNRDMFYTKMKKIKNHQFKLLHSKEGSKALLNKQIDHSKIKHQVCYKAQLFEPYVSKLVNLKPLNTNCITGYWLRFNDFNSDEFKKYLFYIPNKSQWIIEPYEAVEWKSYSETRKEIKLHLLQENAPMVWIIKSETQFEKFFVIWW